MTRRILFLYLLLGISAQSFAQVASAPSELLSQLAAGKSVNVIVEYDDTDIENTAISMRKSSKLNIDDEAILRFKSGHYATLKSRIDIQAKHKDIQSIFTFSHLPMSYKRVDSLAGLQHLIAQNGIKAIYEEKRLYRVLAESLPLINQPAASSVGYKGNGTTVAVIDDGIDYTNAAFGSCTSVGSPSSCRVVVDNNIGSGSTTGNGHGTNVSAIVLGVAPQSKIAMLNVFDANGSASSSSILTAINWAIANKSVYNIVALNLSLGDTSNHPAQCPGDWSATPLQNAKNAGISVVVASGNSAQSNGLSSPACAPAAISVGAVYDSNIGSVTWSTSPNCTDSTTHADQVTCFSNSASYLTLLAPGALITAAGITEAGTSQATPHVAGAIAVLRSAFPTETIAKTLSRLTSMGVSVTDNRNSLTFSRINLQAAAYPVNDAFSNRITMSGSTGATTGISLLASKETGEPAHAGNSGGHSVWWTWTAPASGQLSLDTHGSDFDTLLAVYTGTTVSPLTAVVSNDNDGSTNNTSGLFLQAVANKVYQIAVDGANGAEGNITLNWSINTTAKANVGLSLSGSTNSQVGAQNTYGITFNNAGPQTATNVQASVTLPNGASYLSGDSSCSASGLVVTCRLASLSSASSSTFNIQVTWTVPNANAILSGSVSSDLPDPDTSNNTASFQVLVAALPDNTDVPLPLWANVLAGLVLLGLARTRGRLLGQ